MADIKKNRIIVFESEGIGSQAFSICCLNLSIKGYSTSELLPLLWLSLSLSNDRVASILLYQSKQTIQ